MSIAQPFENTKKDARIEARATIRQKTTIAQAANMSGLSLSDYMVTRAERAAQEDIARIQIIEASYNDSLLLADLLMNSPEPSDNLKNAVARYQDLSQ
jgi:uncharacterized protein (DUF1778 family)